MIAIYALFSGDCFVGQSSFDSLSHLVVNTHVRIFRGDGNSRMLSQLFNCSWHCKDCDICHSQPNIVQSVPVAESLLNGCKWLESSMLKLFHRKGHLCVLIITFRRARWRQFGMVAPEYEGMERSLAIGRPSVYPSERGTVPSHCALLSGQLGTSSSC